MLMLEYNDKMKTEVYLQSCFPTEVSQKITAAQVYSIKAEVLFIFHFI